MGSRIKVAGYTFPVVTYDISEDATPLAANDTSGGTGLLTVTISPPDPDLPMTSDTGMKWVRSYGRNVLMDKDVEFIDTRWGTLTGRISSVNQTDLGGLRLTATTSLNQLNAYNVKADPYSGTLGNLIRYYVSLASPVTPTIDAALDTRPISAQGWKGELWYYLKMLAMAEEFEIAIVNGVLTFRQLRQRTVSKGYDVSTGGDAPVPTLARSVEVYQYSNRTITNEMVYPPNGWNASLEVYNVNAGEIADYTIDLSSSLNSIQEPTMLTFVGPTHSGSSVYTIVANDGLPVTPEMWAARGGALTVRINPKNSHQLRIRLRGATGIPLATGGAASTFSIALASGTSGGAMYSTLRIVGSGVAYTKVKRVFRTGVTAAQTGTDVGITIDNPFLSNKNQTFRAGVRAAVDFAGPVPSLDSTMTTGNPTWTTTLGNISGARTFDKASARPFRLRSARLSPSGITAQYDDDLLHTDQEAFRIGRTYSQVEATRVGLSYRDDYLVGVR